MECVGGRDEVGGGERGREGKEEGTNELAEGRDEGRSMRGEGSGRGLLIPCKHSVAMMEGMHKSGCDQFLALGNND